MFRWIVLSTHVEYMTIRVNDLDSLLVSLLVGLALSESARQLVVCCNRGKVFLVITISIFNKIYQDSHSRQRPRWKVDKEAIGVSRVQHFSIFV